MSSVMAEGSFVLAVFNPHLTGPATGIWSENDVRLIGSPAPSRPYNIDRFLCEVEAVVQLPRK